MIPPVASRFVAGEGPATALARARELDDRGVGAILNLLGEHYEEREAADRDVRAYRQLAADVAAADARACLSVKPSQLGLDVRAEGGRGGTRGRSGGRSGSGRNGGGGETQTEGGRTVLRENAAEVVAAARERDVFVWFDMEDHTTTDATLDVVADLAREHGGGVGVCLQANLRRTPDDLDRLAPLPCAVRLVKGAYDEPAAVAYQRRTRVNEAYRDLLAQAFRTYDGGVAVATHDPSVIDHAKRLHDEHGTDFEFQMLMGVREDAQYDLARTYDVWQYVPYGDRWLSYFYRRLTERKENVLFALRAVLGR